jgi:hypothetical protein
MCAGFMFGCLACSVRRPCSGIVAQALVLMREHFEEIARLCAECQSLINCHDKIAVLSEVHYNLRKTLQVGGRSRGMGWCVCEGLV